MGSHLEKEVTVHSTAEQATSQYSGSPAASISIPQMGSCFCALTTKLLYEPDHEVSSWSFPLTCLVLEAAWKWYLSSYFPEILKSLRRKSCDRRSSPVMATGYIRSQNYLHCLPLHHLLMCFVTALSKSSFSKISADSSTFSNFTVDISKGKRPFFWIFTLILF